MKLNVGILIVGSLYWSDSPHRVKWRTERLRQGSSIPVRVPMRYGRLSSSGSYTMVFAPGCPLGKGRILECIQTVDGLDGIVREAQALWLAESRDGSARKPTETLASDWGCVALLPNPASALAMGLSVEWAAGVEIELHHKTGKPFYDCEKYTVRGVSAITNRGTLQVEWPNRSDTGESAEFDLLLATATKPTPDHRTGDYPNAEQIAGAWFQNGDEYFRKNRKNGFHTFQDEEIEKYLRAIDGKPTREVKRND